MDEQYVDQVRLLLRVLPDIASEDVFALKGGTAINLFHREMPRLSVDIDLAYLPVDEREKSLKDIDETLDLIVAAISERNPGVEAQRIPGGGNNDTRILVREGAVRVKIETSPVTRGTVYAPVRMKTSDAVTEHFGFVETRVLAFEDLYGGKLHAALDRRHPRDLFDVKLLYENEGITHELFRAFMVYVASSGRPMHELLGSAAGIDEQLYQTQFVGMTREAVPMEALVETQERLHADVAERLTGEIATFLLGLHDAEPDFDLIGLPDAANLPAVRWKLLNLEELKAKDLGKHTAQREALEALFQ